MSNWIKGAVSKHPGAFTAQAKAKGETPTQLSNAVQKNPGKYDATTRKRASLARTLRSFNAK